MIPTIKTSKLKAVMRRKELNISGDLRPSSDDPSLKVLLLLYKVSSDCMMPVTQKKLSRLEMKRNSSQLPICGRDRWLFVKTMLIMRKVANLSSCTDCSPEILSMNFSLVKLMQS